MSKRQRQARPGNKGEEIMIFRNRARRPDTRPARTGRANARRAAIQEGSR